MQVVDPDRIEVIEQGFTHDGMGTPCEIGAVGDEADNSELSFFADAHFREAKEADVEIVQKVFADAPSRIEQGLPYLLAVFVASYAFIVIDESCRQKLWQDLVSELERRTGHEHESGAFLLGVARGERREVRDVIFYDDLDPHAYSSGVCVLRGDAFAKLWAECRSRKLTVAADAHTHPEAAFQSPSDKAHPMVAQAGHIAIIIPNFGKWPILSRDLRVYEYRGQHEWIDRSPLKAPGYLYTGLWS